MINSGYLKHLIGKQYESWIIYKRKFVDKDYQKQNTINLKMKSSIITACIAAMAIATESEREERMHALIND